MTEKDPLIVFDTREHSGGGEDSCKADHGPIVSLERDIW